MPELYLSFPSGPSWPVLGWTLPLLLPFSDEILCSSSTGSLSWNLAQVVCGRPSHWTPIFKQNSRRRNQSANRGSARHSLRRNIHWNVCLRYSLSTIRSKWTKVGRRKLLLAFILDDRVWWRDCATHPTWSKRVVTQTRYSGRNFPDRVRLWDEGLYSDTLQFELNCTLTHQGLLSCTDVRVHPFPVCIVEVPHAVLSLCCWRVQSFLLEE